MKKFDDLLSALSQLPVATMNLGRNQQLKIENLYRRLSALQEADAPLKEKQFEKALAKLKTIFSEMPAELLPFWEASTSTSSVSALPALHSQYDAARTKPRPATFSVDATASMQTTVGSQIRQYFTQADSEALLQSWSSLVDTWQSLGQKGFFFGRSIGQRIHRSAYHAVITAKEKRASLTAGKLLKALHQKAVEKSDWPDVSNFWLKGMSQYHRDALANAIEPFEGEWAPLNAPVEDVRSAIRAFWKGFDYSQKHLNKDWKKEVERPSYQHKPLDIFKARPGKRQANIDRDLINRRACKHLLYLVRYFNQRIVFTLDDMDLNLVATGAPIGIIGKSGQQEKSKVPVSTSEISELFRQWDYFKSHTTFVIKLSQQAAPWEMPEAQPHWAKYALHLMRKLLINGPADNALIAQANKMINAYEDCAWATVIDAYHAAQPSLYRPLPMPAAPRQQKAHAERQKQDNDAFRDERIACIEHIEQALEISASLSIAMPAKQRGPK